MRHERPRVFPVAQHRDAIAKAEHFRNAMRDEEDREAALLELVNDGEEMIDLPVGQRRRRLIEHEDLAVERERARDLYELAERRRQLIHRRVRGHRHMQLRQ